MIYIPRPPKPISIQTAKISKEEFESRKEEEDKLKGDSDKVYTPPKGLKKAVKDIYIRIVEELKHADVIDNKDIDIIEITADAIYHIRDSRKHIMKEGKVLKDSNGKMYKSPYVQVLKDYFGIFHSGCIQLGLSPSSRSKLALMATQAKEEEEDDDF